MTLEQNKLLILKTVLNNNVNCDLISFNYAVYFTIPLFTALFEKVIEIPTKFEKEAIKATPLNPVFSYITEVSELLKS